ncbi:MAG: aldehyde dehydrogenase, partial [Alistipes sp.]|nr:aldehyde dehydrogenase [Alistipes sp.]
NTFSNDISQINYCYYNSLQEVEKWLTEHDEQLQCIASDIISHPRRVSFGRAQYPTLWDVADGVDVMNFLTQQ